jgi:excisionase family DNA binding protein
VTLPGLSLALPPDALETIAQRAAELVLEQLDGQAADGRWVRGARGIATYLDMQVSTIQKLISRGELPVHRPMGPGGPVLASTAELDRWAEGEQ